MNRSLPLYDDLLHPTARWTVRHAAGGRRFCHPTGLRAAAFSPDEQLVVTGGPVGAPRMWDTATGTERLAIGAHENGVRALAFSPDGHTVATVDGRSMLRLVDVTTGAAHTAMPPLPGIIEWLGFVGPRRVLAWPHRFPLLLICDLDAEAVVGEFPLRDEGLQVVRVAGDEQRARLAVGFASGTVISWELHADFTEMPDAHTFVTPGQLPVRALDVRPDGTLLVGTWSQAMVVPPGASRAERIVDLPRGPLRHVAFTDDATRIAAADGRALRLFDRATGSETASWQATMTRQTVMHVSSSGRFAAFDSDGVARLMDLTDGRDVANAPGEHRMPVTALELSPDGRLVVSAPPVPFEAPGERILYDHDGAMLHGTDGLTGRQAIAGARTPVALSPDGTRWLCGVRGGHARVFDTATQQPVAELELSEPAATAAAFHPDGTHVAVGSADFRTRLYDLTTGELVRVFEGHVQDVTAVTFANGGAQLITGSRDGTVRVFDTDSAEEQKQINLRVFITCLAVSADGQHLMIGGRSGTAVVFALPVFKRLGRLRDLPGTIRAAVLDADGEHAHAFLVSGDDPPVAEWITFHIFSGAVLEPSDPAALDLVFGPHVSPADETTDEAELGGDPERVISAAMTTAADRLVVATDHGRLLLLERTPDGAAPAPGPSAEPATDEDEEIEIAEAVVAGNESGMDPPPARNPDDPFEPDPDDPASPGEPGEGTTP